MRKLGSKYVYWYNRKYNRIGGLFQDRYKSEPVENDKYLLTVILYIHQNPLKASICNKIEEYKESSYHEYLNPKEERLTDTDFVFSIINKEQFINIMNKIAINVK